MRFHRSFLRPLATFSAGLFALVACQNATDSNSGSDSPVVANASFQSATHSRLPDSSAWSDPHDTGLHPAIPSCGADLSCTDTFHLSRPLGSDTLRLKLFSLGIRTATLDFLQSGNSPLLVGIPSTILYDGLDTLLLSLYANIPSGAKAALAPSGTGRSGLVAYYASLLLADDSAFAGKALPVGMDLDSVQRDLVLQSILQTKTTALLTSLNLGLDTTAIRTLAATLVQEGLLKTTDTLDWLHPVRVNGSAAVSGTLLAGGTPVSVTGSFAWNAGTQVTLSRISVRTPSAGDSSNFQISYQFNPGKADTLWSLAGNLTIQARASAAPGWDTLVVVLSADPAQATLRIPFQVAAQDLTPPTLNALSPLHDTASVPTATATFVAKVVATDSGSGVDSLKIGSKTLRTAAALADTLFDTLPLVVGTNGFLVQAWDHSGNTSTATITVTRAPAPANAKPPTITHVSPVQDTLTVPWGTKFAVLSWTIVGDTSLSSVTVNGHPLVGHAGLFQDTAALTVGSNLFALAAIDAQGLAAYDTVRILRLADTSRPLLVRAPGTSDTVLLQSQASWSPVWNVSDNALDSVTINGIPATPSSANSFSAKVPLAGDSLWITLVAKDSSGNTARDSLKVRRLALVAISGAGTSFSGNQTPLATLASNLPAARIGWSTDRTTWASYPAGGITVSRNEILYVQDTVGSVVSGIDSAVFLYVPAPTLSNPTAAQATVTIALTGSAGIEDSLSTGAAWSPYTAPFTVQGNTKVFARSRLGGSVSPVQEIDFAAAPALNPAARDTGVDSVAVSVFARGADSVQVSFDQTKWTTLSGPNPTFLDSVPGLLHGRSFVGAAVSTVDSVLIQIFPSAPRFSVAGGAYLSVQTVSLSTVPAGANIYYTTDGSTPTSHSTPYTQPLSVATTQTLKAIAAKDGAVNATVDSVLYAIADTNTYGIPWNQSVTYGTLWDTRDNHVYRTVKIGSQTWMAQNLDYGMNISGAFENNVDSGSKYGIYYTWATMMDLDAVHNGRWWDGLLPHQGICPGGWHVPSDSEWFALQYFVDSTKTFDASKLMSVAGWRLSGGVPGNGNDAFGMRVLPAGYFSDTTFQGSGYVAFVWSSSEEDSDLAWVRHFIYGNTYLTRVYDVKSQGENLRCIEN